MALHTKRLFCPDHQVNFLLYSTMPIKQTKTLGVGKTTTAQIVCDQLGLRYAELNASEARNKKLLAQKIGQLLHCRRIDEYFGTEEHESTVKSKDGNRVTHG